MVELVVEYFIGTVMVNNKETQIFSIETRIIYVTKFQATKIPIYWNTHTILQNKHFFSCINDDMSIKFNHFCTLIDIWRMCGKGKTYLTIFHPLFLMKFPYGKYSVNSVVSVSFVLVFLKKF